MKTFILTLLILSLTIFVHAADKDLSHYYFSHISGENGLSQSNVKAIIQDSYGFMWFGTKNGLNRFDGTSIVQMDCDDYVAGKGNHNITALFEDKDRNLWVGTDKGVFIYNPRTDIFTVIDDVTEDGMVMDNWVADIVGDSIGNIWIVVPSRGVFCYRDSTLRYYETTNKMDFNRGPNCICVRRNGEVWVGSWGVELFCYDPVADSFKQYAEDKYGNSLQGKNISSICDYGDCIAITVHEGEVKKYNPQTNVFQDILLPGMSDTFIQKIVNFDNELWIGTHKGLFVVNEEKNKVVHLKEDLMRSFSLSDKMIYTMYRDREGGIWIGTMFGGINYLPHRDLRFDKYVPGSDGHSLSTKRIRELTEDSRGNIWIGTEDDGINVLNPANGQVRQVRYDKPGSKARLITLSMTTYGEDIYCGLFKQGLDIIHLPNEKVTTYTNKELNIEEGSVYFCYIDSRGYKWVGAGWGLYRAEPNTFHFNRLEEVGYSWIFDILEEDDGTLWFTSLSSGIFKYNREEDSFKHYSNIEGDERTVRSNSVSSVMKDSKGRIWFSTDRGGICRYNCDTDDFTTFSVKEGMPDDVAYKILEDDHGNLWFGTNKGLVRFNPETNDIRVFTTKDGLLGNQFNYKSALKASNGRFYFGGIDGLIAFDPNTPEKSDYRPPIYISKFSIYNEEVTVHTPGSPLKECIVHTDDIVLSYDQSNISFDVALLSYSTAEANQYYYMMEPLDRDWIKAASNQNISYAKLPPGNYVFKVKATHGRSGDPAVRSIAISILPPWWLSFWAYLFYTLLCLCIVVSWFLWYRRRKEREMEERQTL